MSGKTLTSISSISLAGGLGGLWLDLRIGLRIGNNGIVCRHLEQGWVRRLPADVNQLVSGCAEARVGADALNEQVQVGRKQALGDAMEFPIIADGARWN